MMKESIYGIQIYTSQGFVISIIVYFLGLIAASICLKANRLTSSVIVFCVLLCAIGHYIGVLMYLQMPTDSYMYFRNATPEFHLFGSRFVHWLVWCVRTVLTGDSLLGVMMFFSVFAFLGQVFYAVLINDIYDILIQKQLLPAAKKAWPYMVILLWPNYMFWTAGIGKDSLSFFCVPLFILSIMRMRRSPAFYMIVLFLASLILFMIRPYYLFVFIAVGLISLVFANRQLRTETKVFVLILVTATFLLLVRKVMHAMSIQNIDLYSIGTRAIYQQTGQATGTAIPVPTNNPYLVFLFLPWTMFANGFLPLFVTIRNFMGVIGSCLNVVLVAMTLYGLVNIRYFLFLRKQHYIFNFLISFFIIGLAFLGLVNTNLGLAMRQRTVYNPGFLICIFFTILIARYAKYRAGVRRYQLLQEKSCY